MYGNKLKDYRYVCPLCFNTVEQCECPQYPETLIQLDKRMVPIIRELNRKLYRTTWSCEGHVGHFEKIMIMFQKDYKFKKKSIPKGFEYSGIGISAEITGSSDDAKKRNKRRLLNDLYEWACSLEDPLSEYHSRMSGVNLKERDL